MRATGLFPIASTPWSGGLVQIYFRGQAGLLERGSELVALLTVATYRWIKGFDGLGFGDVKFVTAATLWIGVQGVPVLLLMAVLSA